MPKYYPSIQERKLSIFEDGCASCGMSVGDNGGYTGDADASGPQAGFDPLMGKLDKVRKRRKKK